MNTKGWLAMNMKLIAIALMLTLAGMAPPSVRAQSTTTSSCSNSNVTENFTGVTTNCSWNFIGGACMTAGNVSSTTSPGNLPSCAALSASGKYYSGVTLNGGNSGNVTAHPDTPTTGSQYCCGALRLTNNTNNESGAIISTTPFSLSTNGLQVTFTTETYEGDSGSNSFGGDSDGADGISFFLQDYSYNSTYGVTLGDFGGSLGYTCSNTNNSSNQGFDGMIGAYLGLGIDDFGNFLDGSWVTTTSGSTTTTVFNPSVQGANPQDNTATGYGKLANRVGLRGAGNVAWSYLNTNYPNYYPSRLTGTAQAAQAVRQTCETGYLWNFSAVTSGTPSGSETYLPASPGTGSQSIINPYGATITTTPINDYAAIANGFKVLSKLIANEGAQYRGYATASTSASTTSSVASKFGVPITYNLTISPAGLLSLSYSYNGGNFQPVITGQSIVNNGPIPSQVLFGFAASTGGSNNIHEIMCFQAQPQNSASSSAGLNQKQTAKVQTGTQVYFAFYNPSNWTGSLTSQYLVAPTGDPNGLEISSVVNWDASCVLTGVPTGQVCATTQVPGLIAPETPDAGTTGCGSTTSSPPCTRQIWSWNDSSKTGIPFTWSTTGTTSLSTNEQTNLNIGTFPTPPSGTEAANSILEYLRGIRADEQTPYGYGPYTPTVSASGFRARTSVLADIVDSSPTWVGPPSASFPNNWVDSLYPAETLTENSGTNTYASFETTYASRMNVVYAGANDGFMHGFRSGYFNGGTYVGTTTNGNFVATDNDGQEVIAYMPGYVANSINSAIVAGSTTPNSVLDYSSPLYAHRYSVDGTPGTGDLYYGSPAQWHTWLVGGLGAGGNAIYALDITNPSNFLESNAAANVIGEWTSSIQTTSTTNPSTGAVTTTVTGGSANFTCAASTTDSSTSSCGNSLGKTYGTPQIRRFHNNPASGGPTTSWGVVFGNGSGSFNGDAGIYVMLANNSGPPTIYYLSTGVGSNYSKNATTGVVTQSGTANGIYFVSPADLDGDHITDYVYAGDLQGNVWRFDLTSSNPAKWAVTGSNGMAVTSAIAGTPIYNTGSTSNPITTQVLVAAVTTPGAVNPRILVEFGTGQQTAFTNNSAATYSTAQQYLIGVWDWNLSGGSTTPVAGAWNAISSVQYASLPISGTAVPSPLSGFTNLQAQSITGNFNAAFATSSTSCTTGSACATNDFYRTISNTTVCWAGGTATCGSGQSATQFGWDLPLSLGCPNSVDPNGIALSTACQSSSQIYEQVIFNPTLQDGAFIVNTTIPPTTSVAQCSSTTAGGWTMAINPATGGAFTNSFFGATSNHTFLDAGNEPISGIALSGTGSPAVVVQGSSTYMVTQTVSGTGAIVQMNPPGGTTGGRITWIEKR
jgi:type IV pilus assembly protein PilY1